MTNGGSSTISRISPETESVVQTIDAPGGPSGIAVDRTGVWVANSLSASVTRLDPESGGLLATIGVGDQPVDVAIDGSDVWVANAASGTVSRIDPASDLAVQAVEVGHGPRAIAAGTDGIWVANFLDGTVARIDPGTNTVVETSSVGDAPTGLALADGSVWVVDGADGSVARIEPRQGDATYTPLGSEAADIAVTDEALWVTVRGAEAAHRGGTLTCDGNSNATGLCDPDIDRRIEEAGRLQTSDPAGARDAWSEIENALVDLAPWVPLGNAYWANLASRRLGNYQSTASGGPLIDQMWVR